MTPVRILLVDDHPIVRAGVRSLFDRRDDAEVTVFDSVGFALEAGACFFDTAPLYGAGVAERDGVPLPAVG
mgnify:CR=1 FL=1